jgi:hypothetical protein
MAKKAPNSKLSKKKIAKSTTMKNTIQEAMTFIN